MIDELIYRKRWDDMTIPELKKEEEKLHDKIDAIDGGVQVMLIEVLEFLKEYMLQRE